MLILQSSDDGDLTNKVKVTIILSKLYSVTMIQYIKFSSFKRYKTLFWSKSCISKSLCDFENNVKVTEILVTLSRINLCKFGENPLVQKLVCQRLIKCINHISKSCCDLEN